ncbi:DUF1097 domain-containing protein [Faecalicatena sp. AGMB00832]|uniref:DUF1097 domain-containing protein n=1 Tax=Faecalicatena faecalis TaxID=2726362 RepID=A0ABS6D2W9_9FIRM|nr:DUF1097 domain-containing protein [Faecalicatena faecalis]MBU3875945.1 DUF1097 domain-containing protein [Faecalicatena faecalis]
MKKSQYLIFAVFVGLQSFLLQLADQLIGTHFVAGGHSGFVFIAFQAWALYFLLGSEVKGAVKGFCGYVLGILFAAIMIGLAYVLPDAGIWTVPVVALIVVPVMMYFEFAPWFISNVAVFFVGAGAFFGINSYVEGIRMWQAAGIVLVYCVLGLLSGWMSIVFRKWLEKRLSVKKIMEVHQIHEQIGNVN